jgi:uncharacterized protein (DUF433 family)
MITKDKKFDGPVLGVGLYTVSDAARLLSQQIGIRIRRRKLHRWGFGYEYSVQDEIRKSAPIVDSGVNLIDGRAIFNFEQLVELMVVGAFKKEGVSMSVIRACHEVAKKLFDVSHPFALQKFDTNGKTIFARVTADMLDAPMDQDELTLELTRQQVAFDQIVRPFFRNLDYVDDIATTLWPLGKDRSVVIDPTRSLGKSILAETGVPTSVLFSMHKGGSSEQIIADWYEVSVDGVRDAIVYEESLRNAA